MLSAFFLWAAFHMTGGASVITGFGIVVGFAGLIVVVTIGSMRLLTWGLRSILNGPKTPPPPSPMSAPLRAGRRELAMNDGDTELLIRDLIQDLKRQWRGYSAKAPPPRISRFARKLSNGSLSPWLGMSAVAPRCIDQTPPHSILAASASRGGGLFAFQATHPWPASPWSATLLH